MHASYVKAATFNAPALRDMAWIYLIALLAMASLPVRAASMSPKLLPNIEAATFEVVASKPTHDPLTYARKLPMDLIPYQQRNDAYHSIGTAFALGDNRYVTAGHVIRDGLNSLWGQPELRDAAGHVYAIDKIYKFSLRRDFVEFSLKHPPNSAVLDTDTTPQLNTTVYAVGNALGTGIVIRNGLYTSTTPEQQDGQWKWMRFSAAASPGNSGGPLLDAQGKVIGVVLAKSPNENLNYALPIREVIDAPDNKALIDKRMSYGFDVFDTTLNDTFKGHFALPESLSAFYADYQRRMNAYDDAELKTILTKDPEKMFPRGKGSQQVLHDVNMHGIPLLIRRDSNGKWALSGKKVGHTQLDDNGSIEFIKASRSGHEILFSLRKPDSVSADKLYAQPKMLMDLLLKSGFFTRTIGPEKIRVTSMGKPALEGTHMDKWHRRWMVLEWPVPYANRFFYVLALPVPSGYVGILMNSVASQQHDYLINMKALTNFVNMGYIGTLAQWKGFLRHKTLLPRALKRSTIDFAYNKHFKYASPPMQVSISPKLQNIQPNSQFGLGFGFFPRQGHVVWDVDRIELMARRNNDTGLGVVRIRSPSVGLTDKYKNLWHKLVHRRHPFDRVPMDDNDLMEIQDVIGQPAAANPRVLHLVKYQVEGHRSQAFVQAKLKRLLHDLEVTGQ